MLVPKMFLRWSQEKKYKFHGHVWKCDVSDHPLHSPDLMPSVLLMDFFYLTTVLPFLPYESLPTLLITCLEYLSILFPLLLMKLISFFQDSCICSSCCPWRILVLLSCEVLQLNFLHAILAGNVNHFLVDLCHHIFDINIPGPFWMSFLNSSFAEGCLHLMTLSCHYWLSICWKWSHDVSCFLTVVTKILPATCASTLTSWFVWCFVLKIPANLSIKITFKWILSLLFDSEVS